MTVWKSQKRQEVFLLQVMDMSDAAPDEILYGGAAGGGKTDALIIAGILYAQKGGKVLYLRRTFPQLEGQPIPRSKELITTDMANYKEGKYIWEFYEESGGGIIKFGHLSNKNDVYNYQGHEYDLIIFDELTQFEEFQYLYLLSRNRTVKTHLKPKIISASNPGGIGHVFVKKRFKIGVIEPETVFTEPQTEEELKLGVPPRRKIFIPAKLTDNHILMNADKGYMARLLALPEEEKRMLLDGDWEVYQGQAFAEFSKAIHVCKPFEIPKYWRRWISLDNGYDDPFAFHWFAVSPDGIVYIYREFTREPTDPKLIYTDQAKKAVELMTHSEVENGRVNEYVEKYDYIVAGVDAWNTHHRDQTGKSLIDYYMEGGLTGFIKATTDRRLRKATWHQYLKPYLDEVSGKYTAKIQIFDTCTKLIETLPLLPRDEKDPEKVADCDVDHCYDGAGYGILSYHIEKSKVPFEYQGVIQRHKTELAKKMKKMRRNAL